MKSLIKFFVCRLSWTLCSGKTVYRGFNDIVKMPHARSDMTATSFSGSLFEDHKSRVYVVGGCVVNQYCPLNDWCFCPEISEKCDIFIPDANTWESCPDAPRQRSRHVAVNSGGKLYVLGGRDVNDILIQEIDVFDPVSSVWVTLSKSWIHASSDLGVFTDEESINGHVYLVGGYDVNYAPLSTLYKFTPSELLLESLSPMRYERGDLGAISVPVSVEKGNKAYNNYVIGGFAQDICEPLATVEKYDIATDRWTTVAPLSQARADMALSFIDNHVFVIGGETKQINTCNSSTYNPGISTPVNDVERLDANNDVSAWHFEEDIPSDRFRFVGVSGQNEDVIYLFGGQSTVRSVDDSLPDSDSYYPILNITMLYVPKSIADANEKELNDGEITGIVLAAIVFVGAVVAGVITYIGYRRYRGYNFAPDVETDNVAGRDKL